LDILGTSEIKRQPIGNHESGGKNSSNAKEMKMGVTATAYRHKRTVNI
jgi:hypothetical protein